MQPMSPLLEGIDETEQILPSNNSNVNETSDYVPINLDHHMESTTTDVEILTNRGRKKIIPDAYTANKQKKWISKLLVENRELRQANFKLRDENDVFRRRS